MPRPCSKEDRPGGLSYSILLLDFDFDLPRLGSFLLGKRDAEDAILEVRRDVFRVEGIGHREAAHETAVAALDAVIALLGMFLVELALARDGERLVLHFDVNVLQIDVRQIGLQHQFVLGPSWSQQRPLVNCWHRPTFAPSVTSGSSTTTWSAPTPSRGRGRTRRLCASKKTASLWPCRWMATAATATSRRAKAPP